MAAQCHLWLNVDASWSGNAELKAASHQVAFLIPSHMLMLLTHVCAFSMCLAGNPALKMQHWMRGIETKPSAYSLGEFCDNLERSAREHPANTRSITQAAAQNGAAKTSPAQGSKPVAEVCMYLNAWAVQSTPECTLLMPRLCGSQ